MVLKTNTYFTYYLLIIENIGIILNNIYSCSHDFPTCYPQLVLLLSFPFVFEDEKKSLGICTLLLLLFNHSPSSALVKWENDCKINKKIQPLNPIFCKVKNLKNYLLI